MRSERLSTLATVNTSEHRWQKMSNAPVWMEVTTLRKVEDSWQRSCQIYRQRKLVQSISLHQWNGTINSNENSRKFNRMQIWLEQPKNQFRSWFCHRWAAANLLLLFNEQSLTTIFWWSHISLTQKTTNGTKFIYNNASNDDYILNTNDWLNCKNQCMENG